MWSLCRKILAGFSLVSCAVWYAKAHFYRDPGSRFFDKSRAYEQKYSHYRRAEVQQFIEHHANSSPDTARPPSKPHPSPSLCITSTSVKRPYTQYVETAVASALGNLLEKERADVYVSVFIAQADPGEHPTWHQEWVRRAVDNVYTCNVSKTQASKLETLEAKGRLAEKGVFDYMYALEECNKMQTPYIGILEDDIMLADGWLVRAPLGRGIAVRLGRHLDPGLCDSFFPERQGIAVAAADEPFGCCAQVIIFPRQQVPLLVQFLREKRQRQVDLLLSDWAEEH